MAVTVRNTSAGTKRKRAAKKGWKKKDLKGKNKKKAVPVPVELPLPRDLCLEIAKHVRESEVLAFSMSCRGFRDVMREELRSRKNTVYTGKRRKMLLTTRTKHYRFDEVVPITRDWIKWAFSMKWRYAARKKYNEEQKESLLTYLAGRGGFKDVLVWLKSEGCFLGSNACWGAARGGHLKVLKYLKSEGASFDSWACNWAALGGHLKVLKYLRSEGAPFDEWVCLEAAIGGHVEVLKYLKSEGVEFDSKTCQPAAYRGHIDVLKYLKSEGLSFGRWTCLGAAKGGHIHVLKYLKSEGMPFDEWVCYNATFGGHLAVLKWLRSKEVNCAWDIDLCLDAAKSENHKQIVTWIRTLLPQES